jgi:hypothetical protein
MNFQALCPFQSSDTLQYSEAISFARTTLNEDWGQGKGRAYHVDGKKRDRGTVRCWALTCADYAEAGSRELNLTGRAFYISAQ